MIIKKEWYTAIRNYLQIEKQKFILVESKQVTDNFKVLILASWYFFDKEFTCYEYIEQIPIPKTILTFLSAEAKDINVRSYALALKLGCETDQCLLDIVDN